MHYIMKRKFNFWLLLIKGLRITFDWLHLLLLTSEIKLLFFIKTTILANGVHWTPHKKFHICDFLNWNIDKHILDTKNTELMSIMVSLIFWEERVCLALVGHPSSDHVNKNAVWGKCCITCWPIVLVKTGFKSLDHLWLI